MENIFESLAGITRPAKTSEESLRDLAEWNLRHPREFERRCECCNEVIDTTTPGKLHMCKQKDQIVYKYVCDDCEAEYLPMLNVIRTYSYNF